MKRFLIFIWLFLFLLTAKGKAENGNNPSTALPTSAIEKIETTSSDDDSRLLLPPEKAKPISIPKITDAPLIDGKLDDEIWKQAAIFKDFVQTLPGNNIAPSKQTEVYLLYDEKNLYIAFKCWDERDKIRATIAKRDEAFNDDNVRVWLDTFNDQRRAYVLGWNPLGIQQDGIFTEGKGSDYSVDIVMESKGVIEDWGWSVEAKIPFKSLRYIAGKGKFWGFDARRNIKRLNDEYDNWVPQNRNIASFLIQHGKITGLEEINTERTLEFVPSITVSESGNRRRTIPQSVINNSPVNLIDPGRFVNDPVKPEIGANIKFNIAPNITLDAAVNPDYAEIEADAPVVTANQRFPIFFQEKRPFFLEGADIFESPIPIFYSRTIIDPDIATKLTGKIGRNTFGFLLASDNAPGNFSEEDKNDAGIRNTYGELFGKNSAIGVLRLKRDVGKSSSLGLFSTYYNFVERKNLTTGIDGRFKLDDKTILTFQAVGSTSKRCFFDPSFDANVYPLTANRNRAICESSLQRNNSENNFYRVGNGFAYYLNYEYAEKNRGFFFNAQGKTRDYRNDVGFLQRTDTNSTKIGGRVSTDAKPNATLIRTDWHNSFSIGFDWRSRSQAWIWTSVADFTMQKNTIVEIVGGLAFERLFEEEFGLQRSAIRPGAFFGAPERSSKQGFLSGSIKTAPSKKYNFGVFAQTIWNNYDYDLGAGNRFPRISPAALAGLSQYDPGTGQQYDLVAQVELKPTDPLRIGFDFNKSILTRYDTKRKAFDSNIFTLRSTYQFSRFTFLRTRIDYNTLTSNVAGQLLFGWNPNPGTAFYVGYNDNLNYNGFSPYTGQFEPRFERNNRTFFIRMSYLFRKSF